MMKEVLEESETVSRYFEALETDGRMSLVGGVDTCETELVASWPTCGF